MSALFPLQLICVPREWKGVSSDIVVLAFARSLRTVAIFCHMVEVCMYRFELLVCEFSSKYLSLHKMEFFLCSLLALGLPTCSSCGCFG